MPKYNLPFIHYILCNSILFGYLFVLSNYEQVTLPYCMGIYIPKKGQIFLPLE
jgi:hypothetical protein